MKIPFYEGDIKLVEKYEQTACNKFVSTIDTDLQAEFRNEIYKEYNRFKNNATDQQTKDAIMKVKAKLRYNAHNYDELIDIMKCGIERSCMSESTKKDDCFDKAEFLVYYEKYRKYKKYNKGRFDDSHDSSSKMHDLFNRLSPEVEGITKNDCFVAY